MLFLKKLEEIKQLGFYDVQLFYGEDVGCDDLDIPMLERNLKVTVRPVGCLGETRQVWSGNVQEFLDFNFKATPQVFSNPPTEENISTLTDNNTVTWCLFGTESAVKGILDKYKGYQK